MPALVLDRSVTGLPPIPAMTTDAERECYYRLAKDAGQGAIIELGAWMGASTAYIAAGVRDSGATRKVQVHDHFISKAGHVRKVKEFYDARGIDKTPVGPCIETFKDNLGDLIAYVEPRQGKIEDISWGDERIALLITDAPKRVPAISPVLTALRKGLQPGSVMAWQDFCHFPSYEIPACLYRLRHRLEFVEAIVPGTTLVFRITERWPPEEVSLEALALSKWTPDEIAKAWRYWGQVVAPEKQALFACGVALFLCDIGESMKAIETLTRVYQDDAAAIIKKWAYLKRERPDFRTRYKPLFAYLESQGAI